MKHDSLSSQAISKMTDTNWKLSKSEVGLWFVSVEHLNGTHGEVFILDSFGSSF